MNALISGGGSLDSSRNFRRYSVSVEQIKNWNNLNKKSVIHPGDKLIVLAERQVPSEELENPRFGTAKARVVRVMPNLPLRVGAGMAGICRGEHATEQDVADTRTIFQHPSHPYTQHLIRSLPEIDNKSERLSIPGQPPALDNPPGGCRFHPRCPFAMDMCQAKTPPLVEVGPDHRVACFLVSKQTVTLQR
jgi:oligopeptide/dipeptide ABC transporter ATP-binding protein